MASPADRRYTESHEWVREGAGSGVVTLGVTKFAVDELTDITYVQMKPAGTKVAAGGAIGEIESVKATSDIYSPVAGEIVEVNNALGDDPGLVNREPYEGGWLVKLKVSDAGPLAKLMDAAAYDKAHAGH